MIFGIKSFFMSFKRNIIGANRKEEEEMENWETYFDWKLKCESFFAQKNTTIAEKYLEYEHSSETHFLGFINLKMFFFFFLFNFHSDGFKRWQQQILSDEQQYWAGKSLQVLQKYGTGIYKFKSQMSQLTSSSIELGLCPH